MKNYKQLKADIILDFYIDEICKFRELKKSDILKKCRKREFADIRSIASYLAKKQVPKIGLREMANYFGLKNHATALYSVAKIEILKTQDWDIQRTLEYCEKLDFVQGVLVSNGFAQVDADCYSLRVFNKILDVENYTNDSFLCDFRCSGGKQFYIHNIDIFDAIIITQNIDRNPLGSLINSLKN
jgi:hypothetical protein